MKRIDRIVEILKNNPQGLTTLEVSQQISARRNDVSSDLNILFRKKIVTKSNNRPVKYSLIIDSTIVDNQNSVDKLDPLEEMLKNNPSLTTVIEKTKEAISYPPNGLNVLIHGETGVGKNYLVEKMWEYSNMIHKNRDVPYVVFNCAEYADNPQLLVSQLFGHVKGAYTGAVTDKDGIVSKAKNGILFLDEIHRLPPTGQELLFNLIDKGKIRRLGETSESDMTVTIIGATTENLNGSLLNSFTRRFPMIIDIPNLEERSLAEKITLISNFIGQEAKRINYPIWISEDALKKIVSFHAKNNIGELRNIISLSCAKSYISFISKAHNHEDFLRIELFDIPFEVFNSNDSLEYDNSEYRDLFSNGLKIYPDEEISYEHLFDNKYALNLYDYIEGRLKHYRKTDLSAESIESKVADDLSNYYLESILSFSKTDDKNILLKNGVIESKYRLFSTELLDDISQTMNRSYSDSVAIAFALHIQQFVLRSKNNKIIYNPNLTKIKTSNYKEFKYLKEHIDVYEEKLGVMIPDDELGFWSLFLKQNDFERNENSHVGLIIMCHGGVASSLVQLISDILKIDWVQSIDAGIDKTYNEIYYELLHKIKTINSDKGILCLVDMGSFFSVEKRIKKEYNFNIRFIPNVNSILALDAAKTIITSNGTLDEIYHTLYSEFIDYVNNQYSEILLQDASENKNSEQDEGKAMIAICSTGLGGAEVIKQYLMSNLNIDDLEIYTLSINDDVISFAKKLGRKLKIIVGSLNPNIHNIPFVMIDRIFTNEGINEIKEIINSQFNTRKFFPQIYNENSSIYETIYTNQSKIFPNVDITKAKDACYRLCREIDKEILKSQKDNSFFVALTVHFLYLFERLKTKNSIIIENADYQKIIENNYYEYSCLEKIVNYILKDIGLEATKYDICDILLLIIGN